MKKNISVHLFESQKSVPDSVDVGFGFTVTIGVPVKLVPVQFASAKLVIEYVFVLDGLTDIA